MSVIQASADGHADVRAGSLEELREPWSILAVETRNVFSTWEWASTWWSHYGEGRRLAVAASYAPGGGVRAIVPLYEWCSRPVKIGRLIGHGPADQLGVVCAPTDAELAAGALHRTAALAHMDIAFAELMPSRAGWAELLGTRPLVREPSPAIDLGRGWHEFLADRSANFRQQLRRRERRLAERYSVRYRLASDHDRLDKDFSTFVSLHRARWGTRSAFSRWEAFVRDFSRLALERGWLRLWFLELAGVEAAAWLGFRFAGVESYFQAGRDPARSDDSVGFLLLAHTIREAASDGMVEYRLLRGGEEFKRRFADSDPGVESHALVRGVRGHIVRALATPLLRRPALASFARPLTRRVQDRG
jgi:CelD/BcsL family acetyltransferase involved in cellulose biosynthesis